MTLPEIDFKKIRLHKGTRHDAFEELCCQLAELEKVPNEETFYRKGPGRDAGLECFVCRCDGSEIGWQAKYYWDISSLLPSVKDSLNSALKHHPRLTKLTVCIPFNLSDPGGDATALKKWQAWVETEISCIATEGRKFEIILWGATELNERLGRDSPLYSGRIQYWFDEEQLSQVWFKEKFQKAISNLGDRYTEENNVELEIRKSLLALARAPFLNEKLLEWQGKVRELGHSILPSLKAINDDPGNDDSIESLQTKIQCAAEIFSKAQVGPNSKYPLDAILDACIDLGKSVDEIRAWIWEIRKPIDKKSDTLTACRHYLFELSNFIYAVRSELEYGVWLNANKNRVLVYGRGGIGKSHLLADTAKYQIERGCPAVLLLGEHFKDDDPLAQILQMLDLPNHCQVKHFLGALDAAGQAAECRTLIIVDALNEKNGLDIWPSRLGGMLSDISAFPHISVVLSCRTTHLPYVIPTALDESRLPRTEHFGFGGESGNAAHRYLMMRGITRPGEPNMLPEFNTPLFLKTCCDALLKTGQKTFPKGLRGVTAIFEFYVNAVSEQIEKKLKLSPRKKIIHRAIEALAGDMQAREVESIPTDEVMEVFDKILDSNGAMERDLLFQLESEGVLAVNPILVSAGTTTEEVRFTFQRFSDHFIAQKLLADHEDLPSLEGAFQSGNKLYQFVFDPAKYTNYGVIEALAIQIPERFGVELLDLPPGGTELGGFPLTAFRESMLWRVPAKFSSRTLELAKLYLEDDEYWDILVSISSEPENIYNAKFLHSMLAQMAMPNRDAIWSAYVALGDGSEGRPVEVLIEWAWTHGALDVEYERAELAATALTWLFSTPCRSVRDRATKALAALLAPRMRIAVVLLERFIAVDDGYVLERLLASIYGGLLQGQADNQTTKSLSLKIYEMIFKSGKPPVNALVRDAARCILEYSLANGVLPGEIDISKTRPPYSSPWPIEYISDETIESFTEKFRNGYIGRSSIVGSAVNDGDFARYVIDYHVSDWSPAPIGTKDLPTEKDIYNDWLDGFQKGASEAAKTAYEFLVAAEHAVQNQASWADTPERKALAEAERHFRLEIGDEAWEEFRSKAQGKSGLVSEPVARKLKLPDGKEIEFPYPQEHQLARFDTTWARRWICKRAHEFGWDQKLHGDFDRGRHISSDRMTHKTERIGKKYQWLALYELRARMADNLAFLPRYDDSEPRVYDGEWHGSLRDCDPSLLVEKTSNDGWRENRKPVWWFPSAPRLVPLAPHDRLDWLESESDFIDGTELLEVHHPETAETWLTAWGFGHWSRRARDRSVLDGGIQGDTWGRIICIAVRASESEAALDALSQRSLVDPHLFGRYEFLSTQYIGEYPWHSSFDNYVHWEKMRSEPDVEVELLQVCSEYTCERGGYDYSISSTVSLRLPAPWVIDELGLHFSGGRDLAYKNSQGETIFFDPSVSQTGPQAGLVRKGPFISALEKRKLAAIWIVGGEKNAYGGGPESFGGRRTFTSLYTLQGDEVQLFRRFEKRDTPSDTQLANFLKSESSTQ